MEESRKFQSSTFNARTRTLFWNYQAYEDAESVRSGNSHVASRPVSFPPHPMPEGMLRPLFASPRRREGPPSIWDTHGMSGNVFANPHASSSALYPRLQRRKVKDQNKIKIWDASLDCQPKIQSSSVEETLQRIVGHTNNDCRFLISILTNFQHQQLLLAGRQDSRLRYALVHNFQLCCGSKKWRWLIQWMNQDLRHLLVVFQCRISKNSMRKFLQHWTESSIIPASRNRSVWRKKKPKKRTVSFAADRSLTWSTSTSGSLGAMILSKTIPTCSQLFVEMTMFRNSIRDGTEFCCQWRKSHLMTCWKDCTN